MGLLDIFRKKDKADGTYHRDRSRDEELYGGCGGGACNGYGTGEPFRITVEDVFGITGRGTVITGQVESGSVSAGDIVRLKRTDGSSRDVAITGDLRDFTPDMALSCAESLSQIANRYWQKDEADFARKKLDERFLERQLICHIVFSCSAIISPSDGSPSESSSAAPSPCILR